MPDGAVLPTNRTGAGAHHHPWPAAKSIVFGRNLFILRTIE
jgi:hypothetical protein